VYDHSNWSQIPHVLTGQQARGWRCEIGADLHDGGSGVQAVAANALLGPVGGSGDLGAAFDAAKAADNAANPLVGKRNAQELRWRAQLNALPRPDVGPSFGYPTDQFMWEHINFDWGPGSHRWRTRGAVTRAQEILTANVTTDPFLQTTSKTTPYPADELRRALDDS
jgi:hypothetical protein